MFINARKRERDNPTKLLLLVPAVFRIFYIDTTIICISLWLVLLGTKSGVVNIQREGKSIYLSIYIIVQVLNSECKRSNISADLTIFILMSFIHFQWTFPQQKIFSLQFIKKHFHNVMCKLSIFFSHISKLQITPYTTNL